MYYRVFFHLTATGDDISSTQPLELPASRLWGDLICHIAGEDDYVGLMDTADNVLQFLRDPSGGYWVELPIASERASFGRVMSDVEVKELLDALPPRFLPRHFPDFSRRNW